MSRRHEKSYRLPALCWLCDGKPLESGFACPECHGTGDVEAGREDVSEEAIGRAIVARRNEAKRAVERRRA